MTVNPLLGGKRFSVGLNLSESYSALAEFIRKYQACLSSIYFSIPLGKAFYSRSELENEFKTPDAEEKLFSVLALMRECGIRSELAINIYGLGETELDCVDDYVDRNGLQLDEIVCLAEYGQHFRAAYPRAEIKYSFNNPTLRQLESFDSIVVGKGYLRNKLIRHALLAEGKSLVLLLNNGCSFRCRFPCGDSGFCESLLKPTVDKYGVDYAYALQSFFPEELKRLLLTDEYAATYRLKISNRPLGLAYTCAALDAYLSLGDVGALIWEDVNNYALFCTMRQLLLRREEFHYDRILQYKATLKV